jgi:hypothetical protein
MITKIIDLLSDDTFYNVSESVEIAKGKYELPKNFSQVKQKIVRKLKYKG